MSTSRKLCTPRARPSQTRARRRRSRRYVRARRCASGGRQRAQAGRLGDNPGRFEYGVVTSVDQPEFARRGKSMTVRFAVVRADDKHFSHTLEDDHVEVLSKTAARASASVGAAASCASSPRTATLVAVAADAVDSLMGVVPVAAKEEVVDEEMAAAEEEAGPPAARPGAVCRHGRPARWRRRCPRRSGARWWARTGGSRRHCRAPRERRHAIHYDDGETEHGVKPEYVQAAGAHGAVRGRRPRQTTTPR